MFDEFLGVFDELHTASPDRQKKTPSNRAGDRGGIQPQETSCITPSQRHYFPSSGQPSDLYLDLEDTDKITFETLS